MTDPRIEAVARLIGYEFDRAPENVRECWLGMARAYLKAADAAAEVNPGLNGMKCTTETVQIYAEGYAAGRAFEAKLHAQGVCHEC